MCGFSSYFHFDNQEHTYSDLDLDGSLQQIHHRGPDSQGKFISPEHRCGLGHTRLSIIDLNGGQQPLSNHSGSVQMVVNGELYDFERIRAELEKKGHEFKTKSDSEIALHLYEDYGLHFVEHLRGEFAINIWDAKRKRFVVVRDRFGIKPVYYTVFNNTLLVASEMKALAPLGWKPEWDVNSILNNGPNFDYRTCFKGVYKLPAGHYLIATTSGSVEVRPYWDSDYPDKNIKETRTVDEMVEGVRSRLFNAVEQRLVADVPVGIYLSGGIDSSCIAGMASKILKERNPNSKMAAFSISFPGDDNFDEGSIAERTAEFCGVNFHKLSLTEDNLAENFEDTVWHSEQQMYNLNAVAKFLLSGFVRDLGYKVVLTGEGADEHFAGYSILHGDYFREPDNASPDGFISLSDKDRNDRYNRWESQSFSSYSASDDFIKKAVSKDNLGQETVNSNSSHVSIANLLSINPKYYNSISLEQCGEPNPSLTIVEEAIDGIAREKINSKWHPLHSALYVERHAVLSNYLCTVLGDRSEMAHSIEARLPFLDHQLCEYVNNLPPSFKLKPEEDGTVNEKWVLKEAVKPYITEELYKRTKHPFMAPTSKNRSTAVIKLIEKLLTKEKVNRLGWIDYEKVTFSKETFIEKGDAAILKDFLIIMSYVVLSERFDVDTAIL